MDRQSAKLWNADFQSSLVHQGFIAHAVRLYLKTENLEKGEVCVGISENMYIKNVSFYYDKSKVIFNNLNFIIPVGKMVFLIGDSGSGKSCIVDMLLRFQQPKSDIT